MTAAGKFCLWFATITAAGALHLTPAGATVRALVVGIDSYVELIKLDGAAADAKDVAQALEKIGVGPTVLLDGNASRQAILQTWNEMLSASAPGDLLIFTYAGHGSREQIGGPGNEPKNVLLLSGFTEARPGNGERIFGAEINKLFSKVPPDRHILFLVDSCHSGTMYRRFDPRAKVGKSRFASYGQIKDDVLSPPTPGKFMKRSNVPNLFFYSAANETEETPEVEIDSRSRGALSWAFSRGIEGAADADRDRIITHGELQNYLFQKVKELSGEQQHPQAEPAGRSREAVFRLSGSITTSSPIPSLSSLEIKLALFGASGDLPADRISSLNLSNVKPVLRSDAPDLILDVDQRDMLSAMGDVVATEVSLAETSLSPILEKWRLLKSIKLTTSPAPLRLELAPGDGRHRAGERLHLSVSERRLPYMIVLVLCSDGTVNLIYPGARETPEVTTAVHAFDVKPIAPFGADHIVAVATDALPTALHRLLQQSEGLRLTRDLADALSATLSGNYQVGTQGIYTSP